jgi:hypothetical protein
VTVHTISAAITSRTDLLAQRHELHDDDDFEVLKRVYLWYKTKRQKDHFDLSTWNRTPALPPFPNQSALRTTSETTAPFDW